MSVFSDLDKLVKNNGSTNSEAKRKEQIKRNIKEAAGMKSTAPQAKSTVPSYVYKDAKKTNDWDLDRIRTFIKTEINAEPNGDPDQVWYNVDYGENQKEGKFYALKCHLGTKKQKTIKKAYNVDELVTYFFGPISEDDFNGYSQYPQTWANRSMIWAMYYNRQAWVSHINSGVRQTMKHVELKQDAKQAEPKRPASESVFDQLENSAPVSKPEQPKDTTKERLQPYSKRLLSAIIQQISNGYLYADPHINGADVVLDSIDEKYLSNDVKEAINAIGNIEDELETMIEKAAQALGKKMPVYKAGQKSTFAAPGDYSSDFYYSTDKTLVYDLVKQVVEDTCEMAEMSDEEKADELGRIYCHRIY